MSNNAIVVEGLSKAYRLGAIGGGTLREDLSRFYARLRGRPDPYAKIGEREERRYVGETFWALRDVSFEVPEGEVLGVVGRNGAGKSTLLKILSRVTGPTSGRIRFRGRIASLLEVGTGFHPELTGKENVYLNGAILGMTKAEVRSKFDEIVAFSEIEAFIDTPVKRYSSGMYVRLAFAVAAHLEPEILVVDEVLAVGDAAFQKKCLGKMQDVASHGRTVLFVSHSMNSVTSLCTSCVHLANGRLVRSGTPAYVVERYIEESLPDRSTYRDLSEVTRAPNLARQARLTRVELKIPKESLRFNDPLGVSISIQANVALENVFLGIGVSSTTGVRLFTVEGDATPLKHLPAGASATFEVTVPQPALPPGTYTLTVGINAGTNLAIDYVKDALVFEVVARPEESLYAERPGMGLRPNADWQFITTH